MGSVGPEPTHKGNYLHRRSLSRSSPQHKQFSLIIDRTTCWHKRDDIIIRREFELENNEEKVQAKTLRYNTEFAEGRHGLDASRKDEWRTQQLFQAEHAYKEVNTFIGEVTGG